jgi:hypothetical protein
MIRKKLLIAGGLVAGSFVIGASPAFAAHDHFVVTPNGECHQVAFGQTAISDPDAGGYHRFHENVHLGATESATNPNNLGDGHAMTQIYKDACPAQ